MEITLPSKTFLIGEYSALMGGDAILLNTSPEFHGFIGTSANSTLNFHPLSPAGRLIRTESQLRQLQVDLHDPWAGAGGFGASSAQFLTLEYYRQVKVEKRKFSTLDAWDTFRKLYADEARPPSGYDVLAQCCGNVAVISERRAHSHVWSFKNLEFLIIPTGVKIATHDHLGKLGSVDLSEASDIAFNARQAFEASNEQTLCEAIQQFRTWLNKNHLESPHTTELVEWINKQPGVRASKGCGALGADAMVVVFEPQVREQLAKSLSALNISKFMNIDDLRLGLRCGELRGKVNQL